MNTVSIFLYLASVIPSLGFTLALLGALLILIMLVGIAVAAASKHEYEWEKARGREGLPLYPVILRQFKWLIPVALVSIILSALLPDKQTMHMIAASELGEEVISTPEAKQLYQDLRDILATYKAENK